MTKVVFVFESNLGSGRATFEISCYAPFLRDVCRIGQTQLYHFHLESDVSLFMGNFLFISNFHKIIGTSKYPYAEFSFQYKWDKEEHL